ncbi:MAG: isoleucine--tRNA ligase [Kiritimatiellia bacterium]
MFQPVSNKVSFPEMEEKILSFWGASSIFQKSLEQRRSAKEFVFYDGPPFATGLPHYGHLLAGTIKDIIPRYQAMRGHYVERRFGWDCHGLPIEALAQEALGLAGSAAIREAGVDVFNEKCRSMVLTYVAEWRKTVTRMGRWVDFDNDYKTMDPTFMETIWWVFKQLWEQGRIYKDHRIMPYSWKLTTPLSNFEAGNNYQQVQDPAVTLRFKLLDDTPGGGLPVYALAWTTTPWTLPANLALCAGPDIDYVVVKDPQEDCAYLLAEARLGAYYKKPEEIQVLARKKGADLAGLRYEPLLPYFAGRPNCFRMLVDGFVSTGDGTGIVHIAPAYGEDDHRVGKAAGIELVDPLDADAKFTSAVPDFAGQFCKDADKGILRRLKDEGKIVHQATIVHSYPFCERTDTPLIYRAIEAWYVRVEDIRDQLVANNQQIRWVPDYVGSKRFGNWLQEAKDWNISRNRFWGSCIPVWVAEDGSDSICVGSVAELEALSGVRVTDLHKHTLDAVTFTRGGKLYRRTPEVLDCWFESGAMPYAQQHYPFENQQHFEGTFPADFIAEGLDQTRGWFYTLMVLSTALFQKPAFRNVIVNGLILAEDGQKMSKRKKNYPDPNEILNQFGADALRLYMINSPVTRAENLNFSGRGVEQVVKDLLLPLWNAYSFFVTYANTDGWTPAARTDKREHPLDRWILSSLNTLENEVVRALDAYVLQQAVRPFVQFIDDLTNWYIRRSRRRFWKTEDDSDKRQAYSTLYEVLLSFSRIAAPIIPFISEEMYRNLRTADLPESVHLTDYPTNDGSRRDEALERQMELARTVVTLGRNLRTEHDLKVRQPLAGIHVVTHDEALLRNIGDLVGEIREELNVKEVWFARAESQFATAKAKADYKVLGPKHGPAMKAVAAAVQALSAEAIYTLLDNKPVTIQVNGKPVELQPNEVTVERTAREGMAVAAQGAIVVALETALTPELIAEGLAREFVSRVQAQRKAAGLDVADRIRLSHDVTDPALVAALETHRAYICAETLAVDFVTGCPAGSAVVPAEINGIACPFALAKS